MSNDIAKKQIEDLRAPFPVAAHSIRQGHSSNNKQKCIWFVYLDRMAIIDRLDEVFPGEWEYTMSPIQERDSHYSSVGSLTIRGKTRSFNGTQTKGNYAPDNDEKGCGTDTFRRAASMWGIGSYLHNGPDIWTALPEKGNWEMINKMRDSAMERFANWLNGKPQPPAKKNPTRKQPKKDGKPSPKINTGQAGNGNLDISWHDGFIKWTKQEMADEWSMPNVLKALSNSLEITIDKMADYPGDKTRAMIAIGCWLTTYDDDLVDDVISEYFAETKKTDEKQFAEFIETAMSNNERKRRDDRSKASGQGVLIIGADEFAPGFGPDDPDNDPGRHLDM
jgi:hypothetical protein